MKAKEIEALIDFIAKSGLEEVNIETEQIKLAIKKSVPTPLASPALATPHVAVVSSELGGNYRTLKSPMIGTFYRALEPEAAPLVEVGAKVEKGQKLCIIEAMKLFNEIEADFAGTIIKVLAEDASPVAYDQPLFLIDPA